MRKFVINPKKALLLRVVLLAAVMCLFIGVFRNSVWAQSWNTYYVDINSIGGPCSDSNPGTITQPWQTISKANQVLEAGDMVYIRAGTYSITGSGIDPANTGTSGNVITFSAYNDEEVEFVGAALTCRAVDLDSDYGTVRSYIKVHRITFTNFYRHLWIRRGDYNEISYCTFTGMYDSNIEWRGSTVYRGATYNYIHHCTFGEYGKFTPNDVGVVFELGNEAAADDGTSYNLIEDCTFYHGGHHVLGMNGHHNVVRNNYVYNDEWSDYEGTDYSNRVFFMVGYDNDDYRNLIEGNRIAYGGECADSEIGGSGGTLASSYNIIRRNMYYQNGIYGFKFEYYPGHSNCLYNYVYNNVFWHNGHSTTGPLKDWWSDLYSHALYFDQEDATTQYNRVKNNIFYDNKNTTDADEPIIKWGGGVPTQQTIANNWKEVGDPKFVNISGTPDPNNETQFNFNLQFDSPCIDNGGFLTVITSSTGSGTIFTVDDADYFMDGWGIIDGDLIQLEGQTQTARVTAVDYDNNIITVDISLTWNLGQGVSLVYSGSAPDIGAYEFGLDSEEDYPVNVYPNPCRVYQGENTITFFGDLGSGDNIKVYDMSGKLVHDSGNLLEATYQWNVNDITSGVFFFVVKSADGQRKTNGKIVVIR